MPPDPTPLCVDLDGTLLPGDTSLHLAAALLRRRPWLAAALAARFLLAGRAPCKTWLARSIPLPSHALAHPLPQTLRHLRHLRQTDPARPIHLVTGSPLQAARLVADHFPGLFDQVHATLPTGHVNLIGPAKARLLLQLFGPRGFDYIGNSRSDLHVWPHARHPIAVNCPPSVWRHLLRLRPDAILLKETVED